MRQSPGVSRAGTMHLRPETDRAFHRETRIERSIAVLEYHLHLAAELLQRQLRTTNNLAVEQDVAAGRRDELHDEASRSRFAAAELADDAERLSDPDVEVDAVDRADEGCAAEQRVADGEVLREAADTEKGPRSSAPVRLLAALVMT